MNCWLGMEPSSLADDSDEDQKYTNYARELKLCGLEYEFGGILGDGEAIDDKRGFTGEKLLTASDDPTYIFKNVICHRRRRDADDNCTCLTSFINRDAGAFTIDELIRVIVQSMN